MSARAQRGRHRWADRWRRADGRRRSEGGRRSDRRRSDRRHGRWASGLVALGLVAAMLAPTPQDTEAFWVDQESATATLTALTVPRPENAGACVIAGSLLNLLSSSLTIRWRLPAGTDISAVRISYTGGAGLVPVVDTLLGTDLKTTQEGNVYVTKLTGRLLNAVLGASRTISVYVVHPSGWTSIPREARGDWPILGLGTAQCVDL